MSKTFKTASLGYGYGALGGNEKVLRDFVNSNPDLLEQIGGPKALDAYIKEQQQALYHNPESAGEFKFSTQTQDIDKILQGYQLNSVGAAGLEDGRKKAVVKDGETLYEGDAYSYTPAKDNLETALRGAALIGGTAGLSSLVGGLGAGGASAGNLAAQNAALDAAMIDAAAGSAGGWGGVGLGSGAGAGGLAGAGAGIMEGGGLINNAFANTMAGAGSLAPEGVAALIPTGAELGAIGGGSLLAGGPLGGGMGSTGGGGILDSLLGKVGDKATGAIGSQLKKLLPGGGDKNPDWLKMLLPALAGYASYKDAKKPQMQGYTGGIKPRTATQSVEQGKYGPISRTKYAPGGIVDAGVPRYLGSAHDGMEDGIAAHIDGKKPAALSGGEFVVPADVVSHIGNGNSNAGAKQLFQMMDRIRAARTGNSKQGKQINPDQFMPV